MSIKALLTSLIQREPSNLVHESHAETSRAMTEALLVMEEREQRDEALLREALYALEYASDMTKPDEDLQGCECPICTNITALRERLNKKEQR